MGSVGASRTITSIGAPAVATGPDDSDWEDTPMLGINIFNQGKEVKTEYKHRLPVRIGVKWHTHLTSIGSSKADLHTLVSLPT